MNKKKSYNGILTEQQVKNFKQFWKNIMADISYTNGGYIYFIVRMLNGAFWLWLSLGFIKAFYYFAIFDRMPLAPKQYELIQALLFATSALFIMLKLLTTVKIEQDTD